MKKAINKMMQKVQGKQPELNAKGHILDEVCKVDSQNNKSIQVFNKNWEKCCRLFSDCKAKGIKEKMKANGGIKKPKKNSKNSDDTDGSKDSDNDNSSGTGDDSNHSSDNGVNADSSGSDD